MLIELEDDIQPLQPTKKPVHRFGEGNQFSKGIGRKGKEDKTISKQLMTTIEDKKAFKHKVQTIGLTRLWLIMEGMHDLDFARTMLAVMPFVMPKVASIDARDQDGKEIHDITGMQQVHTITIKDMRTGLQSTIISE